ncbi:hypothetical protein RLOatenuis_3140 [Rickettsiales bacterium]|nr:hypothetical protein RLOatenuis_3140 [Rickettsiales bacterium]
MYSPPTPKLFLGGEYEEREYFEQERHILEKVAEKVAKEAEMQAESAEPAIK